MGELLDADYWRRMRQRWTRVLFLFWFLVGVLVGMLIMSVRIMGWGGAQETWSCIKEKCR